MQSLFGILCLLGLAYLLSNSRKSINWRTVIRGLALQWVLAFIVLKTSFGALFFDGAQNFVRGLIDIAKVAGKDIFGESTLGLDGGHAVFGAIVIVTVVFFSAMFTLLHHLGFVKILVGSMSKVMSKLMGTSGSESTVAAANIFVGQTEAPLLVRPYLATMTRSELGAIMTVGFATVAGGVFAIYVEMMGTVVPDVAGHLLAATLMSAPMGLAIAKIVFPETETSPTMGKDVSQPKSEYSNVLDATATGASEGMKLSINILAMLIAFLGVLGVINWLMGSVFGDDITLQSILGTVFAPIAWLLGVPASEMTQVGALLGTKMAVNEYVAFIELQRYSALGLSDASKIIASYALCGFSNFSSIAIQIGGLSTIVPERRKEIASLGLRAMLAGTLATYCTAATASLFLT
ncbi:MAG: nucleoside transporter C-terminal domain-containing protein [Planctomycetota bacterium]|nr:nucleoside transporter C-terminal domain-containing protein [Planctomycetota bacterium]MDG2310481.1 nucleoside transporter C-terminal domain-containing protein [Planctomycetota bacterium]